MIFAPYSSYCCFVIHILWKLGSEERIEPPIQTENFRSGGAEIRISFDFGISSVNSFSNRFFIPSIFHYHQGFTDEYLPGNMVDPPDKTMFLYMSLLTSKSHFIIDLKMIWCIPGLAWPISDGLKSASGHLYRSCDIVTVWPSGRVYTDSISSERFHPNVFTNFTE